jgi:O-antigen/teichoic acid export membrane protein
VIDGLLQKHERLNQVAIAIVLKGLITGSAFIAGYIVTDNLVAATCALAAGLLVVRPVQMIPIRSWPPARRCCRR